jgi:hypothetical protein
MESEIIIKSEYLWFPIKTYKNFISVHETATSNKYHDSHLFDQECGIDFLASKKFEHKQKPDYFLFEIQDPKKLVFGRLKYGF